MKKVKIYHNPRCSKSRQTLQILEENGVEPEIIKYLETPPTVAELERVLELLNKQPRDIMRKNEAEYKEYDMSNENLSKSDLIRLMREYPKVIERPIVFTKDKAAIGRPPESVLDIL